ncbi:4-hydroxy-tetrahydrodipicolinate synthase [Sphingobium fuliginis]|jgi:4-hydroxy-tetrahydrodipicolinate synthase|uniref:4-hydroxy-tetrahydrodipicolinate synthase n=1 Tax=Sphingobium fuliginis (strain ATCC 27551) TaxID=336203 RepID=A0A292ZAG0_SPHSA|nr:MULTISPECIES: 4-hydroxy-tetrahydrodipicolinate synthase [Sphingobium]AJR22872.1 dihydrodipicolinate synthase [Sphingobium sp. YBL2]QOT71390.1 4-hydroxy-tetrahydrodipicolinate synthase [Sphingobium fuliginis]GAY19859.1 4-hydroxy-tetrahydrodipicolinate synthase [Sphingobium fuliginis]
MFSGSIPALITPFRNGAVDEAAFRAFVDWQIGEGSSALVPCGTTGESATMTVEEHNRVIAICVDQAAGRVPVIAGCGSNDTRIALEHMFAAQAAGADAALVVAPYYNKPNQEGVYRHFAHLAERCSLPIILYNVPSRTITDIGVPVIHRLSEEFQTIVGIKDATGNLGRVSAQRLACRADFCQLSGNDETALGFNAMGGRGCISVTANVAPRLCAEFQRATANGDWHGALALQDRLYPLHDALFSDSSPGPVKYALTRVRPDMSGEVRLPITWPSESSRAAVDRALEIAGLV